MYDTMPTWFWVPLAIVLWILLIGGYFIRRQRAIVAERKSRRETYQRTLRENQRAYFRNDMARPTNPHTTLRKNIVTRTGR